MSTARSKSSQRRSSGSAGSIAPMRVVWSFKETGPFIEPLIHQVLDRAAAEGIGAVEMCYGAVDSAVEYRALPKLRKALLADSKYVKQLRDTQAAMTRIGNHAKQLDLRLGIWHHDISGPNNLLELVPQLRAKDGLIDLDSPVLYQFITGKISEFFKLFPQFDELVLTMTETAFPILHRPFCDIPPLERLRRLFEAILAATEPAGKLLVVRPFSAIRKDELHVRDAVALFRGRKMSLMYKTEPFDWHPFLPNDPLIGTVKGFEARCETDAGAEYYGQAQFPACYLKHLKYRLTAANQRGSRVAIIRIDRGLERTALGHPINEANVVAVGNWLKNPSRSLSEHFQDWLQSRHGVRSKPIENLFEQTFEVVKKALYIDQQALSHHGYPNYRASKHIQVFGLLEEKVSLSHMALNWGVLAQRQTLTHFQVLEEKQQALELARRLPRQFLKLAGKMPADSRARIHESLSRLEWLALSCQAGVRTMIAHLQEVWGYRKRDTRSFTVESKALLKLADEIERRFGPRFLLNMPEAMRSLPEGLSKERKTEIPLRRKIQKQKAMVDYVLCGYASEGHRLAKWLHSGETFPLADRYVRATGLGPDTGITYHLAAKPRTGYRLRVTFASDGVDRPGIIRIGQTEQAFNPGSFKGLRQIEFVVPAAAAGKEGQLPVRFWSTTPQACWIATIELFKVAS